MAISFVSSANNQQTAGTTLTIACPSGIQANDLLLAFIFVEDNTDRIVSYPTGWIQLINATVGTRAIRQYVYYKFATGSEPSSYNWTLNASDESLGFIQAFRGVDLLDPIGSYNTSTNTGSTSTLYAPDTYVELAGNWLVYMAGNAYGTTYTEPSGYSNVRQTRSGTSSSNISGIMCSKEYGSAGLVQGVYATAAAGDYYIASLVELRQPQTSVNLPVKTATFSQAGVSITASLLVTAGLLTGVLTLFAPSCSSSISVTPEPIEIKTTQLTPSITTTSGGTINLATLQAYLGQPGSSITAELRTIPDTNIGSLTLSDPIIFVSGGSSIVVWPDTLTGTLSLPNSQITASLRTAPDAITLTGEVFNPTHEVPGAINLECLTLIGRVSSSWPELGVDIEPDILTLTGELISPASVGGGIIYPDTLSLGLTQLPVSVSFHYEHRLPGANTCQLVLLEPSVYLNSGTGLPVLTGGFTLFEPRVSCGRQIYVKVAGRWKRIL